LVFDKLVSSVKVEARSFATTLICAVVAGMSGVVAVLFTGIAIFIWASERYGSLTACLAMAGFFVAVALIALAVLFYARGEAAKRAAKRAEEERREREEEAKNAPPVWMDPSLIPKLLPMLLPIALKAGQIGIKHRGLLIAALSSAVIGWGLLRERNSAGEEDMPAAEQPAE
jgi:H+/gluconate symporter-like permease